MAEIVGTSAVSEDEQTARILQSILLEVSDAASRRDAGGFRAAVAALRSRGVRSHKWQSHGGATIGDLITRAMAQEPDDLSVWRDCIKLFDFETNDWKLFSQACVMREQLPEALTALEHLSNDPASRSAYLRGCGRICVRMADWSRALVFFGIGVVEFGDRETLPGFLLERANVHWQLGMFEEAAADFTVIKARWPASALGYEGLIKTFCANRAFVAAQCIADEAAARLENLSDLRSIQAMIIGEQGGQPEIEAFLAELASEPIEDGAKARIVDRTMRNSTNFKARLWDTLKELYHSQPSCLQVVNQYYRKRLDLTGRVIAESGATDTGSANGEVTTLASKCSGVAAFLHQGFTDSALALAQQIEIETSNWPSRPDHVLNVVLWRMVRTERIGEAKDLYWRQKNRRRRPDRRSELSLVKEGRGDPRVVVFAQVRNEAVNLPSFLDHHRRLGVKEFCIIDNCSTDETAQILSAADDVTHYETASSYRRSGAGADWFNALVREPKYAGSFCVRVDADERFVYPHCDRVEIARLRTYMLEHGFDAIAGPMVDMFPGSYEEIQRSGDHIGPSRYFEAAVETRQSLFAPYVEYYAPARLRSMDGLRPQVSKVPGTIASSMVERIGSHRCSPAAIADVGCALLHYKFRPNFAKRAVEEIARKEYAQNGQYWTQFPDFEGTANEMASPISREFTGWSSLVETGLLKSSFAWDRYIIA